MPTTARPSLSAHTVCVPLAKSSLRAIAQVARTSDVPFHLHIAEQVAEVEQCVAATGRRPVEYLLDTCDVDDNWCLVHATHLDTNEVTALAETGAVVCLCPTTEANLGDGLFPLRAFLEQGGRIAIGSDSQVSIDPCEELRWLEYGQRLSTLSRNVAAVGHANVGYELFSRSLAGGAQATASEPAGIVAGSVADLVELAVGLGCIGRPGRRSVAGRPCFFRSPLADPACDDCRRVAGGRGRARARGNRAFRLPGSFRGLAMNAVVKPRYQQLKEMIIERISNGELRPADRVPSENELVESMNVSRMTANRALRELNDEGYVERVAGKGTFVADLTRTLACGGSTQHCRRDCRARSCSLQQGLACVQTKSAW